MARARQLFGEDEDDTSDLDAAAAAGEDGEPTLSLLSNAYSLSAQQSFGAATEIDNLRKEASAFKTVRAAMLSSDTTESASTTVFKKVHLHPPIDLQGLMDEPSFPPGVHKRHRASIDHGRHVGFTQASCSATTGRNLGRLIRPRRTSCFNDVEWLREGK